jgi:hypothetical protein
VRRVRRERRRAINVSVRPLIPLWTRIAAYPRRKQGPYRRIALPATQGSDRECELSTLRRKNRLPRSLPRANLMKNARRRKEMFLESCIPIRRKKVGISQQDLSSPKAPSPSSTTPNRNCKTSTNDLFIALT